MPKPLTTTRVLPVLATDGTPLSVYRDPPARPRRSSATVVLVHGASVTADLWRLHTRHLNELGLDVLRYDQRAHGHTPRGTAPLTIAQLADDLHQILTHLQLTGPLVLAGHSLGALVLQELAAAHPQLLDRVRGMMLLSPTARGATLLPGRGRGPCCSPPAAASPP
ncbi:alpha/beta hydrolase [Streptomyces sp. NPDC057002]|uniref:alpha/beta hydrolase n=1 Tax=Streptomyces sp. NPDC057002 TaxID=3345992 RepID=UPI0036405884